MHQAVVGTSLCFMLVYWLQDSVVITVISPNMPYHVSSLVMVFHHNVIFLYFPIRNENYNLHK